MAPCTQGHLNNFRVVHPTLEFAVHAPYAERAWVIGDWDNWQVRGSISRDSRGSLQGQLGQYAAMQEHGVGCRWMCPVLFWCRKSKLVAKGRQCVAMRTHRMLSWILRWHARMMRRCTPHTPCNPHTLQHACSTQCSKTHTYGSRPLAAAHVLHAYCTCTASAYRTPQYTLLLTFDPSTSLWRGSTHLRPGQYCWQYILDGRVVHNEEEDNGLYPGRGLVNMVCARSLVQ